MCILLVGLVLLALLALLLGILSNQFSKKEEEQDVADGLSLKSIADMECCGQHEVCEKESLLAAVSKSIEYYDDEELDAYRGTASDQYTEEQIEAFRDVFYTMRETDVAGWVRSLQLRGVELPDELKDEVFLVVGELRMTPALKK